MNWWEWALVAVWACGVVVIGSAFVRVWRANPESSYARLVLALAEALVWPVVLPVVVLLLAGKKLAEMVER